MRIKAHSKDYEVLFEDNFSFLQKLATEENIFWVVDCKVKELYEKEMSFLKEQKYVFCLEALEENKTIETALCICEEITQLHSKRNTKIVSIGGGIIQDITGFVANVLYRGIQWTYIPTTLLAQCDSCIGGKTSLNYKQYKNLLGTFYPPDKIIICPKFVQTLSHKDYYSGLGEVVKFNIMAGTDAMVLLQKDLTSILERDDMVLQKYIEQSLRFKQTFIEEDEYDKGVRILLNFAHTFGHAIETVTAYRIPHGTAVAMGTWMANRLSLQRGYLTTKKCEAINEILFAILPKYVLQEKLDKDSFLQAVRKDKKNVNDKFTLVLFKNDELDMEIFSDVERKEIENVLTCWETIRCDMGEE